jgi:hypothetical protein
MNSRDDLILSMDEKQLVQAFLLRVLPPISSKRRGRNNELATITNTIDKWFKRNLQIHVGISALAELFEELGSHGYTLRPFGEDYDPDQKTSRAVPELGEYRGEKPYAKREAMYIYINIDPKRIADIRKLSTTLPLNTRPIKLLELSTLQDELRSFIVHHMVR